MGILDKLLGRKVPLVEAVELTSDVIFCEAVTQVRELIRAEQLPEALGRDPESLNETAWELILEVMAFSLHWADRIAFDVLGPDRRATFMDALVGRIASGWFLTDRSAEVQARDRQSFLELHSSRQGTYAGYSEHAEKGAPLKGTLSWEAAKLSAGRLFPDATGAPLDLLLVFATCPLALKDLPGRLQRLGE